MTASTVKTTVITDLLDTTPRVKRSAHKQGGLVQVAVDTIELTAATSTNEVGDAWLMLPLPSHAVLHSLKVYNDDLDSNVSPTLAVDIGLYNGASQFVDATDGTFTAYELIDADAFAAASTVLQAAVVTGTEVLHVSAVADIKDHGEALWQIAGLDADPGVPLVVGFTVTTEAATGANGTVTVVAKYTAT